MSGVHRVDGNNDAGDCICDSADRDSVTVVMRH